MASRKKTEEKVEQPKAEPVRSSALSERQARETEHGRLQQQANRLRVAAGMVMSSPFRPEYGEKLDTLCRERLGNG